MQKTKHCLKLIILVIFLFIFTSTSFIYSQGNSIEESLYSIGLKIFNEDYSGIVHYCNNILEYQPKNLLALKYMIIAKKGLGQIEEAIKYYKIYTNINNNDYTTHLLGTETYIGKKDTDNALKSLSIAEKLNRKDFRISFLKVKIYKMKKDYKNAIHYCKLVNVLNSNYVPSYYLLGELYEENGLYKKAEKVYLNLKEKEPNSIFPDICLASLYKKMGLNKSAKNIIKKILKSDLGSLHYIYSINGIHLSDKKSSESMEHFLKVYNNRSSNGVYNRNIGYIYYLLGDIDTAQKYFIKTRYITYPKIDILNEVYLSIVQYQKKEMADAIERLKKIIKYFPDNLEVLALLGYFYHKNDNEKEGLKYTENALKKYSKGFELILNLSLHYIYLEEHGKANTLIATLKTKEYLVYYYIYQTFLLASAEKYKKSFESLKEALKLLEKVDSKFLEYLFTEKAFLKLYKNYYKEIIVLISEYL